MESIKNDAIQKKLKCLGYENKKIKYDEFQELHKQYAPELSERQFAEILELSTSVFHNLKYRKDAKSIILKNENAIEECKEEILMELKEQDYENKYITYDEFKVLYDKYGKNLPEVRLANLLGISKTNLGSIKSKGTKAKVLKNQQAERKIKADIVEQIEQQGKKNKTVNYKEFRQLYIMHGKGLTEIQFANVLGIKSSNLWCARNRGTNLTILMSKLEDMQDDIEQKLKELKNNRYSGILITYNQFIELYNEYGKNLNEVQFASLLGIKRENLYKIKNHRQRARIDFEVKDRLKVRKQCSESRFYSKTEIEEIIKEQKITVDDFIRYAFNIKAKSDLIELYREALLDKGKLYIGKTIINKQFMEQNAKELLNITNEQSVKYGKMYGMMQYSEDISSEILLVLMEKYGEVAYNFENNDAMKILTRIAAKSIRYEYMSYTKIKTYKSIDEKVKDKDGSYHSNYNILEDKESQNAYYKNEIDEDMEEIEK